MTNELDGLTALIIEPHAGMRATSVTSSYSAATAG